VEKTTWFQRITPALIRSNRGRVTPNIVVYTRNSPLKKKVAKHMISERHSNSHPLKPWKGHTKVGQSDSADK
jgi:hypothetical protein